jgi:predicted hydrolase (HD superfamily)
LKPQDALQLLHSLQAPERLLRHVSLVLEAGEQLLRYTQKNKITLDADWVRCGILLHDAGKILHPEELSQKGAQHEPSGEALLLKNKVPPHIARCCMSHARWMSMECSLEELLVALADKLWKGVREQELELRVIDALAQRQQTQRWDVFLALDSLFEQIAQEGDERLGRS